MVNETFEISNEIFQFYKNYTGIKNNQELEAHLNTIQYLLSKAGPTNYRCIQRYRFAVSRICHRFFYKDLLSLAQELLSRNEKPYFLDVGCCTGTDLRKLIVDGYPNDCLIGMDNIEEYIKIGYSQFKDNPASCPIKFIAQDVFQIDKKHYLCNTISIIHAGSVVHLFNDDQPIINFLKKLTLLLKPGGVLVGGHISTCQPIKFYKKSSNSMKYLMDANSFSRLLTLSGFTQIKIETIPRTPDELNRDIPQHVTQFWLSFYAVYHPSL